MLYFRISKSVNKLLFCQVGKFSFLFLNIFKMLQNPEKCLSQFFLTFWFYAYAFSRIWKAFSSKNTIATFFRVGGSNCCFTDLD